MGSLRGVAVEPPLQEDIDVQRRYQSLVKHSLSSPFCKASTVLVVIKMKTRVRRASRKPGPGRGPNPGDAAHDYIHLFDIFPFNKCIRFLFWMGFLVQNFIQRNQNRTSYGEKSCGLWFKAKYLLVETDFLIGHFWLEVFWRSKTESNVSPPPKVTTCRQVFDFSTILFQLQHANWCEMCILYDYSLDN